MSDRALSLLGLIRRAGKLSRGYDAVCAACRGKRAALVLFARDLSPRTAEALRIKAERAGVRVLALRYSMEELWGLCGIRAGALSIDDPGFARSLEKIVQEMKEE